MPLFSRGLSESDRSAALELIAHLQTMYAYQQLAMERFNDAVANASTAQLGSELDTRTFRAAANPVAAQALVMPALEEKKRIAELMWLKHSAFARSTQASLSRAYDDFTTFLGIFTERAAAQHDGWMAWLANPRLTTIDTSRLDVGERRAIDASINSLNALIRKAGLRADGWLDVNCAAFNQVRLELGLSPLDGEEFRIRFLAGQAGAPTRYFRD